MTTERLQSLDEKFYAEVARHRRRRPNRRVQSIPLPVRRYAAEDEMTAPANARSSRPYVFGHEPLY